MKLLISFFLFLASISAWASPDASVVKITSSSISGGTTFRSSGLAFQRDGKIFVVGSEHGVLHTNDDVVHLLTFSDGTKAKAQYLLSDWGKGLVLLQMTSQAIPQGLIQWSDIESSLQRPALTGDMATLYGYPALSQSPLNVPGSRIENASNTVAALGLVRSTYEISQTYAEYGMSGGPAFLPDGHFLGTITHQVFDTASQSSSTWEAVEPTLSNQQHILVIPAPEVIAWVDSFWMSPVGAVLDQGKISLYQESYTQLQPGFALVESLGVNFDFAPATETGVQAIVDINLGRSGLSNSLVDRPDGLVKKLIEGSNGLKVRLNGATAKIFELEVIGFRGLPSPCITGNDDSFSGRWAGSKPITGLPEFIRDLTDPTLEPLIIYRSSMSTDEDNARENVRKAGSDVLELSYAQELKNSSTLKFALEQLGEGMQSYPDDSEIAQPIMPIVLPHDVSDLLDGSCMTADWEALQKVSPSVYTSTRAGLQRTLGVLQIYEPN